MDRTGCCHAGLLVMIRALAQDHGQPSHTQQSRGQQSHSQQSGGDQVQGKLPQAGGPSPEIRIPLAYRLLVTFSVLALFGQWLIPLTEKAEAAGLSRLVGALGAEAVLLALCTLVPWRPGWSLVAQTAVVMFAWFAGGGGSSSPAERLAAYTAGLPADLLYLVSGRMGDLSLDSRLLLLAAGWGMLVSSVHYLAVFRQSTVLFSTATLAYLLLLDSAFGLDTEKAVILTAVLIVWLQGLKQLLRLKERYPGQSRAPYIGWSIGTLFLASGIGLASWITAGTGGAGGGAPALFRETASWLQKWTVQQIMTQSGRTGAGLGTTGYGMEGGELGAPLQPNSAPVFTAKSDEPVYWRGESFAVYDGRRWRGDASGYRPLPLFGLSERALLPAGTSGGKLLTQHISLAEPSRMQRPLFGGGLLAGIGSIRLEDRTQLEQVLADGEKDSFRLPDRPGEARVTEYTVYSLRPDASPARLRKLSGDDPAELAIGYTQLPDTLPKRVRELAAQIAGSASGRYERTEAVRSYLQSRYTYTLDTRIPPAGADFTDDFLFVSNRGYCVHFATAMTVLLRTLDIPSRFVQGYGPGESLDDGRYSITQRDAHAWVEVYFPGAGWIPFDPTPPAAPVQADAAPAPDGGGVSAAADRSVPVLPQAGPEPAPAPLAFAALLPAAAWRWRRALALLRVAQRQGGWGRERLLAAAAPAWQALAARYGAPPPGCTAREYAGSLAIGDDALRGAVLRFVRQWETLAYGEGAPPPYPAEPADAARPYAAFLRDCLRIALRTA